jgi:hypothetical protein
MNYAALAVIAVLICACSSQKGQSRANPNQEKPVILAKQENPKYRLTAIFYGESLGDATGPTFNHIAIRNDMTGEESVYEPTDRELLNDKNNIRALWSPDGEFLLLLRGNVDGICIIKSTEAEKEIKNHNCFDFIRVHEKSTGTALMHSYGVWDGNDEFKFSAGLSGDLWQFSYNIKSQSLTGDPLARNFEGENRNGRVSLVNK